MRNSEFQSTLLREARAISSPMRLRILQLLKDPVSNFPPQVDGDLLRDGVCADFIREKLAIAPATASRHLSVLRDAGLLLVTRQKGWTFYRRDEAVIRDFARRVRESL
ncbi:MAG: winged helix-turn-helix transcriptional regulator [Proteobacteria bacterium]|nr:winged helix-turn-helix transcriptional regulator [Pseudomonadota bacterium]